MSFEINRRRFCLSERRSFYLSDRSHIGRKWRLVKVYICHFLQPFGCFVGFKAFDARRSNICAVDTQRPQPIRQTFVLRG